jgi:uncharacterized protein YqeY
MSLQQQLADDLKTAMKARDAASRDAIRLLISTCKNKAVELGRGPQGELSDDEVQSILKTEKKRRDEAAAGFDQGGATERADGERAEALLIAAYLPTQMSDEQVAALVAEAVAEAGEDANMGLIMKASMAKMGGLADGKRVQAAVKAALAG